MELHELLSNKDFVPIDLENLVISDLQSIEAIESLTDEELEAIHMTLHDIWDNTESIDDKTLADTMDVIASHKWVAMGINQRGLEHKELSNLDNQTVTTKSLGDGTVDIPDEIMWVSNFISVGKGGSSGEYSVVYNVGSSGDDLLLKVNDDIRSGVSSVVKDLLSAGYNMPEYGSLLSIYDLKLVRKNGAAVTNLSEKAIEAIESSESEENPDNPVENEELEPAGKGLLSEAKIVSKRLMQQIITCEVLVPEEVDAHNEVIGADVIEQAAYDFVSMYNKGTRLGLMHLQLGRDTRLVESYIAPIDMLIGSYTVKKGTWLVSIKVEDPVIWEAIMDGTLTGLSIGGLYSTEDEDDSQ